VLWAWSAGNGVCDGRICGGTWANPGERREAKTFHHCVVNDDMNGYSD